MNGPDMTGLPPEVVAFLTDGGYATLDDWMADSDYRQDAEGQWFTDEGHPADPLGAVEGAMEAAAFRDAH
jgi:hypothetical protein